MKKRILYLINPHSGVGKKTSIEKEIVQRTDPDYVDYDIQYTKYAGHATEIVKAQRDEFDVIVAVGGDGTVNEIGTGLIGSQTKMGIIPCGSGNGLARELDIPLRPRQAVDVINQTCSKSIDVMLFDGRYSLNVAGVGFDAYISHQFAKVKTRGPMKYINIIMREYPKYEAANYTLEIDGNTFERKAFLISFANSSQWGNDVHIAPNALMDDGLIDVCVISEFPNIAIPSLLFSLFNQSIEKNKYDEIIRARSIKIVSDQEMFAHADGEPIIIGPNSVIEIKPLALNVVVPGPDFFKTSRFKPSAIKEKLHSSLSQLPFVRK
ncbi:MAG: diacylglycerol kinase family lipid kinase [Bacteroidales bacterium]|nr:diacylglycerol kinase family lipid kinase [Bacteroidales bacterium]